MVKIDIICNERAGKYGRFQSELRQLSSKYLNLGVITTKSIDDIIPAVEEIVSDEPDVIGICGGDGTVNRVLSGLFNVYGESFAPIMLIPAGTMNYLSKHLGYSDCIERLLKQDEFLTKKLTCLNVNNNHGFLFGAGFIPEMLITYESRRKNMINAAVTILGMMLESAIYHENAFTPAKYSCSIDGIKHDSDYSVMFAGSYGQISFGIDVFPKIIDDKFGYLMDNGGALSLLCKTMKLALRKTPKLQHYGYASTLELDFPRPMMYTIDGELYADQHIWITAKNIDIVVNDIKITAD